jgi:8-oxo-dGTP pyrophosphatase MutT (NUDIX family)
VRDALDEGARARLVRLLDAHEPWDDAEAAHVLHVRAFVQREPDPFWRGVIEGHLTGSAFVLDPAGRVLLTHHLRLDIWVQLGGHADDGEQAADSVALREAREESGLRDVRFHEALSFADGTPRLLDVDVHRIPGRRGEPAHDHLDLRFLLRTGAPDEVVANPSESKALEWVALDEAARRGDAGMGRAIARLRALRA